MLLRIDPTASLPLFDQLAGQLRVAIVTGAAVAGERLPAARDLADSLGINRNTVLKVYQALRDEGLLELRPGRGAIVIALPAATDWALHDEVRDLARRALSAGISYDTLCALLRKEYP